MCDTSSSSNCSITAEVSANGYLSTNINNSSDDYGDIWTQFGTVSSMVVCGMLLVGMVILFLDYFYSTGELELVLDADTIQGHIQSVRNKRGNLKKISLKAFGDYTEQELYQLFQEIAAIPRLKAFSADMVLVVNLLTYLLQRAQHLRELTLMLQQRGSERDIERLADSIQRHPRLKTVSIESFPFDSPEWESTNLDPLLISLANLSCLRTLVIDNLKVSANAFDSLFQSPYIQKMDLSNVPLLIFDRQLQCLERNKTLHTLIAPIHDGTSEAWARMVQRNTALLELTLKHEGHPKHHPNDNAFLDETSADIFLPVIEALGENTTLHSVSLQAHPNRYDTTSKGGVSLKCLRTLANAIASNKTLKSISIDRCQEDVDISNDVQQDFAHALKYNFNLTKLEINITSFRKLVIPEAEFYLKCNRVGRGALLQGEGCYDGTKVADFLIQNRGDLDVVFYMLSEMPAAITVAL